MFALITHCFVWVIGFIEKTTLVDAYVGYVHTHLACPSLANSYTRAFVDSKRIKPTQRLCEALGAAVMCLAAQPSLPPSVPWRLVIGMAALGPPPQSLPPWCALQLLNQHVPVLSAQQLCALVYVGAGVCTHNAVMWGSHEDIVIGSHVLLVLHDGFIMTCPAVHSCCLCGHRWAYALWGVAPPGALLRRTVHLVLEDSSSLDGHDALCTLGTKSVYRW